MRHTRPRRGHGFMDILKKANNFLKKTQAVSKIANAVSSSGIAGKYTPYVSKVAEIASSHGYGRHRRHRRAYGHRKIHRRRAYGTHHRIHHLRRGRGFMDFMKKANNFLRNSHIVSKVANALGSSGVPYASQIGSVAGKLGYGRRRYHRRGHGIHHRRIHHRRGRGIGHVYTPQSGVGIAGTTTYSQGRVIF